MSLDDQKAKSNRFLEAPEVASTALAREDRECRLEFKATDFVVYPAHGVGQILSIEEQTVAGSSLEFFVIYFTKSKMTVRVPVRKAAKVGMRKPSDLSAIQAVKQILSEAPGGAAATGPDKFRSMKVRSTLEISSPSRRSFAIFFGQTI